MTIPVLGNDTDVDGDTLVLTGATDPAHGSVAAFADGTVVYTPDPDFHGTDSFNYTISDGNGGTDTATVTITVDPVNDAPVAVDNSDSTPEDTPVIVAVLGNDSDPEGDPLTVTGASDPSPSMRMAPSPTRRMPTSLAPTASSTRSRMATAARIRRR